jgi:DNA-binding MarR family transcriptional regulator
MLRDAQARSRYLDALNYTDEEGSKSVYFDLLKKDITDQGLVASRTLLQSQLEATRDLPSDLPDDAHAVSSWIEWNTEQVGSQYQEYLIGRKAGAGRRYFSNKSHALYFLKCVAPTKLVDGAWLYGLVHRWNDARFSSLIRIYLEELGEGIPNKNHVALYRALLASHGCEQWSSLPDQYFVQGAIQLSLAYNASEYLPEVIGFNLGYEQLPLHLLITAYELNELGIDPYYFTLHVTVDNAATGHAQKSLQGLLDASPWIGDSKTFYRRVVDGYKLNMLGAGTTSIISSFDLDEELISIFREKSTVGKQVHSDYCRVAGRTVNDWLSDPAQIPAFLDSLEKAGWIKRHQEPQNSRFWNLIQGGRAEMFGVFTAYEQQVIYDWIAGDMTASADRSAPGRPQQLTYKAKQRLLDTLGQHPRNRPHSATARGVIRRHLLHDTAPNGPDGFNAELRMLEETLASLSSKEETMSLLTQLMSPSTHHTAAGLMATRIFTRLLS